MGCILYLPLAKLQNSPYSDLASPSLHLDLEPLFEKEYCASLGMSRQAHLRVVTDIGGGGALARIEKGRKVMRERKGEWSQTDELPVRAPGFSFCRPRLIENYRLKSHCQHSTVTTLFLRALSPRNNLPITIHP